MTGTPPPHDPADDPAVPQHSRRRWLERGVGLGVTGAALLATGRTASATVPSDPSASSVPPPQGTDPADPSATDPAGSSPESSPETTLPPSGPPTGADVEALQFLLGVEVAARDLYQLASDAGAATTAPDVIAVLADNHDASGEAIGAELGASTGDSLDVEFFDERRSAFDTTDVPALAEAAYELESELVATHIELLGVVRNVDVAALMASILITESRHCAVLADLAGMGDDLEALLVNSAEPLDSGVTAADVGGTPTATTGADT